MENEQNTEGIELEKIFKAMEIPCKLMNTTSTQLADKHEFNLTSLKDYTKLNKCINIITMCMHKDVTLTTSEKYHFALEIKKDKEILNFLTYNKKYKNKDNLTAFLGIDNNDRPIFYDVQKTIHTLIGGATGMGKTSLLNNIIYSLTSKNSPDQLKLCIIDIKKTLAMWDKLPHLTAKPMTDCWDALDLLEDVSDTIEKRLEKLAKMKLSKATPDVFPYLVVVIDELADLMLSDAKKYIENAIVHIAQVGRSANVSLIIATQNPIVKVCTSSIKANCPTRIALKTMSSKNSSVILEDPENNASKLKDKGWAIMRCAGDTTTKTFKACYLTDTQIQNYIKGEENE